MINFVNLFEPPEWSAEEEAWDVAMAEAIHWLRPMSILVDTMQAAVVNYPTPEEVFYVYRVRPN